MYGLNSGISWTLASSVAGYWKAKQEIIHREEVNKADTFILQLTFD